MIKQKTITIFTLNKIKKIFEDNPKLVMTNRYIANSLSLHSYCVEYAIKELLKDEIVKEIQTSSKGRYYQKNN